MGRHRNVAVILDDIAKEVIIDQVYSIERFEYVHNMPQTSSWVVDHACTSYAEAIIYIKRARSRKAFHARHYRIEALERTDEGVTIHYDVYH